MPDEPTISQLALVISAAVLFAASVAASVLRRGQRAPAIALAAAGLTLAVAGQLLHSFQRGDWLPLQDNFDALLWLGIMIAAVSLYLQGLGGVQRIDWIANPIVVLFLAGAAAFGAARPHTYTDSLWYVTHIGSYCVSTVAFAVAACAGSLYLALRSKLRRKAVGPVDSSFGSLERLERLNFTAVKIGFALMTVGLASGLSATLRHHTNLGEHWLWQPKVLLSFVTYGIYAIVLHSPINPQFRGKKTAILSIAGFIILLATVAVVQK
ncbi:MAG: cytochrome c biogenesis protein CcsA [Tepidisphaeraceae bacterium]